MRSARSTTGASFIITVTCGIIPSCGPAGVYSAGTPIGYLGNTGNAGVAHLHYQVKTPRLLPAADHDSDHGMALLTAAGLCLYDGRGRRNVNSYDKLVRLAQAFRPPALRRGPSSTQYILEPGATHRQPEAVHVGGGTYMTY